MGLDAFMFIDAVEVTLGRLRGSYWAYGIGVVGFEDCKDEEDKERVSSYSSKATEPGPHGRGSQGGEPVSVLGIGSLLSFGTCMGEERFDC